MGMLRITAEHAELDTAIAPVLRRRDERIRAALEKIFDPKLCLKS
jgi:hypothetical protein